MSKAGQSCLLLFLLHPEHQVQGIPSDTKTPPIAGSGSQCLPGPLKCSNSLESLRATKASLRLQLPQINPVSFPPIYQPPHFHLNLISGHSHLTPSLSHWGCSTFPIFTIRPFFSLSLPTHSPLFPSSLSPSYFLLYTGPQSCFPAELSVPTRFSSSSFHC